MANTASLQVLARHPERGATAVRCEPKGEQPVTELLPRSAATTSAERRQVALALANADAAKRGFLIPSMSTGRPLAGKARTARHDGEVRPTPACFAEGGIELPGKAGPRCGHVRALARSINTGRALAGKARTARHELRAEANVNRASQSAEANGLREASRALQQRHLALANV